LPDYVRFVLDRLDNVEETSDGWICLCPNPDHGRGNGDHNPSLRISVGEAGRLLVCCRTGCPTHAVLAAADLRYSDLFPGDSDAPLEPRCHEVIEPTDAEKALRNRVYRFLLARLALSEDDRRALRDRGLSREGIEEGMYRTLAPDCMNRRLSDQLLREFDYEISRVPGFVSRDDQVGLTTTATGLLIPVADVMGRVIALKIRRSHVEEGQSRYCYLSGGEATSGAPYHWPLGFTFSDTVRVTEGEIKAHIATEKTGLYTVSIPGVSNWRRLTAQLPIHGIRRIVLAYDWPDVRENRSVFRQWDAFREQLQETGDEVAVEIWADLSKKGIDDALEAGQEIEVIEGEQLAQAVRILQAHHGETAAVRFTNPAPVAVNLDGGCASNPTPPPASSGVYAAFPVEVLPDSSCHLSTAIQRASGCPVEINYAYMIALVARAIAASWSMPWLEQAGEQRANLWIGVVAPSGVGKSVVQDYLMDELHAHHEQIQNESKLAFLPQAVVTDQTSEAFFKAIKANADTPGAGGVLAYYDELTAFLGNMDRYAKGKGGDRAVYLGLHNGGFVNKIRSDTGASFSIRKPSVVVCGNITPGQLRRLVSKEQEGDGFVQRFLWHVARDWTPPRATGSSESALRSDDERIRRWSEMLRRLHAVRQPVRLKATPEAVSAWADCLNEHLDGRFDPQADDDETSLWSKSRAHASRLAAVLHAWQLADAGEIDPVNVPPVEAATIQKAWKLIDYYVCTCSHVIEVLKNPRQRPDDGADAAAKLYEKAKEYQVIGLEAVDISKFQQKIKHTTGLQRMPQFRAALDVLCRQGLARMIDKKTARFLRPAGS
jgi:hypothetical protein